MSRTNRFAGVISVLPTAFDETGALDLEGIDALVDAHRAAGVAGLTVLGVMGEAAELTESERTAVVERVGARREALELVIGVTGDSAEQVRARTRDAVTGGATAVMVSPTRSLPLADAVGAAATGGLPMVVQDYPAGYGVTVSAEAIAGVAASHRLVACVKVEAPPTSSKMADLHRLAPEVALMGGLGGLFLIDELRAGASGVMTGFAVPEALVAIVATFPADPTAAERAWTDLLPLMRLEAFPPYSLAARKEVWRLRGVIRSAYCRRPGAVLDDRARDDVRRALDQVRLTAGAPMKIG